jgi:hypothetical protein
MADRRRSIFVKITLERRALPEDSHTLDFTAKSIQKWRLFEFRRQSRASISEISDNQFLAPSTII